MDRTTIGFALVHGLDIASGETMRLWDYDPETPLPIEVHDAMRIDSVGTLRIVIEDAEWGSTLAFEGGIDVLLDGTLDLLIDPDEDTTFGSLVGVTYNLLDWTGVTPTGQFASITMAPGLEWDTLNLYTTGQVTLTAVPEPACVMLLLTLSALALARCPKSRT